MIMNRHLYILLISAFFVSLPTSSYSMDKDGEENKNPPKQLRRDPWDFYYEDLAEKEENERYQRVWNRAKEIKKRIKFLEAEMVKEAKKSGEIPSEYPDEKSFTFRYHDLTKELEELREEQMETSQHFGGVNPPTSDEEDDILDLIENVQFDFSLIDERKEIKKENKQMLNANVHKAEYSSEEDD